jgi:hypothetical protein
MRRLIAFSPPAVVRALLAKALVVAPAIGAAAAANCAFENDAIAFFDVVNGRSVFAKFFNAAKNFVAEDNGIIDFQFTVEIFDVRAADSSHLYFNEAAVCRNIGNRIFTDLKFIWT